MSTLHIYHNMHLKSKINTFNKNDVIILHNRITINLLKHLFRMNRTDMNELNLTFITIEELLQGKIDNMRFDYIVGNPPYQYPAGVKDTSSKLYIDISVKCFNLLKDDGIISFITPTSILKKGRKNKAFKFLNNRMIYVNLDANNSFNVGSVICMWTASKSITTKTKVLHNNTDETYNTLNDISTPENKLCNSICNKLDYTMNGRKHLKINDSANENGLTKKDFIDSGKYKVYTNSTNSRYTCTNSEKQKPRQKLIIPFSGNWKTKTFISDILVSNSLFVSKSRNSYSLTELLEVQKFLATKIISYAVCNYSIKIKPSSSFGFLFRLPEIDFSREWTDDELYKEFNLTDDEINEVENWYKEWIS